MKIDLLRFLGKEYNREDFNKFLQEYLNSSIIFNGGPANRIDEEHFHSINGKDRKYKYATKFYELLDYHDQATYARLRVFEVALKDKDLSYKRAYYTKLVTNYVTKVYDDEAHILVVFYNEGDKTQWRLSYIELDYDFENKKQITPATRYTYLLGENVPVKTAKTQLEQLKSLNDLKRLFSVEPLSDEFFQKYKELFEECNKHISESKPDGVPKGLGQLGSSHIDTISFSKHLMGQIVFIYFLQKKGWLGCKNKKAYGEGDKDYLYNQFNEFTKKDKSENKFFNDFLEPLFYKGFNEKRDDDVYPKSEKQLGGQIIPYLNGGLFEPIGNYNWQKSKIPIPNDFFKKLFETFNSYNFTVVEDDTREQEVAVDPEMLGKIFERLLDYSKDETVNERKKLGAFYTPRKIVHYMCNQSILQYLLNNSDYDKNELETLVLKATIKEDITDLKFNNKKQELINILKNLKICDPAIGSGAFALGIMNELMRIITLLKGEDEQYELKKQIIENNIYGVDIEFSAIDTCRLRMWLSLIVDYSPTNGKIAPLPNLDYKFMEGNSLIPLDENNLFEHSRLQEYNKLQQEYFNKQGSKLGLKKDLDELKKEIYGESNSNFDFRVEFYNIFNKEDPTLNGFDIIIGNPPYVPLQKSKELTKYLNANIYKTYEATGDLYVLFYELSYKLLKKNGVSNFITSNKWLRAGYGEKLRKLVKDNVYVNTIIDFKGYKNFKSATVDTNILIFSKQNKTNSAIKIGDKELFKKLGIDIKKEKPFKLNQKDLDQKCYILEKKHILDLKQKIEAMGKPLKDWDITINRGILTGSNNAFIIDTLTKDKILNDCQTEEEKDRTKAIIKPLLRGKDIKRYTYNWADKWLINSHNGKAGVGRIEVENGDYPSVYNHLLKYEDKASKRQDKGKHWTNLRNCSYLDDFEKEKIVFPRIIQEQSFIIDSNQHLAEATANIITGKNLKYLLTLLNSNIIYRIFNLFYEGGGIRGEIKLNRLAIIPIPEITPSNQEQKEIYDSLCTYGEQMQELHLNKKENQKEIDELDQKIDNIIYKLYNLTETEIKIIEGSYGSSANKQVELIAIDVATKYYEKQGYYIESHEHKKGVGYDLLAIKIIEGKITEKITIEVKGKFRDNLQVYLSASEYNIINDPKRNKTHHLVVISNIKNAPQINIYTLQDKLFRITHSTLSEKKGKLLELTPTSYISNG